MAIDFKACCVDGCKRPVTVRGFCNLHYCRVKKYGDPLGGSTPNGEPQRYFAEVVIPYEGEDCLIWPYGRDNGGYGRMNNGKRMKCVSRILCEETRGEPPTPKHHAAHSCGKGHLGCVTKSHLSWKTRAENMADKLIHGTHRRGERCHTAKLKEQDVILIRSMQKIMTQDRLAKHYGVDQSTISDVMTRRKWAWLP